MKFRVKQTHDGSFIVQYKKFLFWNTIRRAWVHERFWPDYIDESFTDFNRAVDFCKKLDELQLKIYINKQKEIFKQGLRLQEDYIKSKPVIKNTLSFTYESTDKK